MGISNRDDKIIPGTLGSQSGQAIVEYILVLVVTVAIILGAVYQLNGAFKAWSKEYFGSYLSCLLETGELPSIGGAPGDSGICNQLFKPFDPKAGRPLLAGKGQAGGGGGKTGGARETQKRGSGGSGNYNLIGGKFAASNGRGVGLSGSGPGKRGASDSNYTGSTGASGYGGGYSATNHRLDTSTKNHLDNRFAFDKESEDKQKRNISSVSKGPSGEGATNGRIQIHRTEKVKDAAGADDNAMTFGNFIRFLIIAAIVIALIVLVGGQMLSVGKSMD